MKIRTESESDSQSVDARPTIHVGTAGWTIPSEFRAEFTGEGSHLQKYAQKLNCTEINSSFYREHKPDTYAKWASAVPDGFRFSVKLLRYFTQEMRLKETGLRLNEVLTQCAGLGEKWGALLVQLPPSLEFVPRDVERFIIAIKKQIEVPMVWEPRNQSFRSLRAMEIFSEYGVSKVLADPERVYVPRKIRTMAQSMIYLRLHGSPIIYRSLYSPEMIETLALRMQESQKLNKTSFCIFDNTTFGHAMDNALALHRATRSTPTP